MNNDGFWNDVRRLVRIGDIPTVWTVADLEPYLLRDYELNTIRTNPPNYCEGTGYHVRNGRKAQVRRKGEGRYELIESS